MKRLQTKPTTQIGSSLKAWVALLGFGLALAGCALYFAGWHDALLLFTFLAACGALIVCTYLLLRPVDSTPLPDTLSKVLRIARDERISLVQERLLEALEKTADNKDTIFRELAESRLQAITGQVETLASGTIEYSSTESWRVAYEQLLRSPGLHLYRSVAHVESAHYWQDGPGQQSTRLNLELHDARVVSVERTAIIADHLWPESASFPVEPIHRWLEEQHRHGIWLRLVRESLVAAEPDLLADFGIYGSRAVGVQLADPAGRTLRFQLTFDFEKVQQAETIWERLAVYATPYRELLEQRQQ